MQTAITQKPLRTLIVSAPGVMGDSLRTMLASFPQIEIAGSADGCLSAYSLARSLSPDLVVIDANLPESDVLILLQSLTMDVVSINSITFVNTLSQKKRMLNSGAAIALLRSDPIKLLADSLMRFYNAKQAAT